MARPRAVRPHSCLARRVSRQLCSARFRVGAFDFVHRLVGERVGFAILFAIDVIDAEGIERGRHFSSAFVKRREFRAANFVQTLHLFDEKFGVALDAQCANALRLNVVERGDQAVVFGDVVGHPADKFFQAGDRFAFRVANIHTVCGGPGLPREPPSMLAR